MKWLFLLFSSLSLAKDITITINDNVPRDISKAAVISIFDLNNSIGNNKITFVDSLFSYKVYISYSNVDMEGIAGEAVKNLLYCRITLYPLSRSVFKTTVWHEIGHCAGLNHKGYIGQIMSEKVLPFEQYSKHDVNVFLEDMKGKLK